MLTSDGYDNGLSEGRLVEVTRVLPRDCSALCRAAPATPRPLYSALHCIPYTVQHRPWPSPHLSIADLTASCCHQATVTYIRDEEVEMLLEGGVPAKLDRTNVSSTRKPEDIRLRDVLTRGQQLPCRILSVEPQAFVVQLTCKSSDLQVSSHRLSHPALVCLFLALIPLPQGLFTCPVPRPPSLAFLCQSTSASCPLPRAFCLPIPFRRHFDATSLRPSVPFDGQPDAFILLSVCHPHPLPTRFPIQTTTSLVAALRCPFEPSWATLHQRDGQGLSVNGVVHPYGYFCGCFWAG